MKHSLSCSRAGRSHGVVAARFPCSLLAASLTLAGIAGAQVSPATDSLTASLPDAPSAALYGPAASYGSSAAPEVSAASFDLAAMEVRAAFPESSRVSTSGGDQPLLDFQQGLPRNTGHPQPQDPAKKRNRFDITSGTGEVDENGKPINHAVEQPKRIFGFIPNFRSVSASARAAPPGFRTNFRTATRQALDPSAFIFLFITSASAYGLDSHPAFDTLNGGNAVFWSYLWRGFVDKTDGTFLGSFLLPSLLHEDTRYYAMGPGHPAGKRALYAASRVIIARRYDMHSTPNIAGIGGKIGTQAISTTYYPAGTEQFSVLATKFTYSCLRDAGFTVLREFAPDIDRLLTYKKRHRAALAAAAQQGPNPPPPAGSTAHE